MEKMEAHKPLWCVGSYDDLLLMQRAFMEARFALEPVDPVLLGSPRAGAMHGEVVREIIRLLEATGDRIQAATWREWLRWNARDRERDVIRQRSAQEGLRALDHETQLAYLRACVRPFDASDADIEQLLEEILEVDD